MPAGGAARWLGKRGSAPHIGIEVDTMKTHHHTSYRGLGRRRGAAAVVLLLLLAGCSPSVSSLIHDPAYSYEEFRYAAG